VVTVEIPHYQNNAQCMVTFNNAPKPERVFSVSEPAQRYSGEIESEYQKLRSKINNGERLPYKEYIKERAYVWVKQIATHEELKDLEKVIKLKIDDHLLTEIGSAMNTK